MTVRATAANPDVLKWARESVGLSVSDVAVQVGQREETIEAWEAGEKFPTYRQLEILASKLGRPLALFFFPYPPEEEPLQTALRTLPAPEFERLELSTKLAIRDAMARQESLRELTGGINPASRRIVQDIRAEIGDDASRLADRVRSYLAIGVKEQQAWSDAREAFQSWRATLADVGVFVFRNPMSQLEVSGFCLFDETFPIIVVNSSTAWTRQVFTLFHELGHLLHHVSGITDRSIQDSLWLDDTDRSLEVACNTFAAELLVPTAIFPWTSFSQVQGMQSLESSVTHVARRFNVSREVILRRLRDLKVVSPEIYKELAEKWIQEFHERRSQAGGGNYYANQVSYLGDQFLDLAFSRYYGGTISLGELSEHLGIKSKNIESLEDYIQRRAR